MVSEVAVSDGVRPGGVTIAEALSGNGYVGGGRKPGARTGVDSRGVLAVNSTVFLFQAEDGIRVLVRSRGLGDVYKRQQQTPSRLREVPRPLSRQALSRLSGRGTSRSLEGVCWGRDPKRLLRRAAYLSLIHI